MEWLWLVLTIIAALAAAIYTFFDNYIVDVFFKGRTPQAQKVFFGPAYLATAVLIALFANIQAMEVGNAIGLIVAGALASISYIPYYVALGKEEATSVTILEQLSPIFYLIFGWLILGESISEMQLAAFAIILLSPLAIVLGSRKNSQNSKISIVLLMVGKVTISALANVSVVKFSGSDLMTSIFYITLGKGLCDIIMSLIFKKWRLRFRQVAKKHRKPLKFYGIFLIDHLLWLVSDFTYYAALTLAPVVAMVSAVAKSAQPILVFVLGIVLTAMWPKFGREKNNRRTIISHFIATVLAVIGIVLMQI